MSDKIDALGRNIRESRKILGLTTRELAEKVGVERTSVTKYENGKHLPDLRVLVRLSEALGVSVTKLLGLGEPFPKMPSELRLVVGKKAVPAFEAAENYVPVPLLRDAVAGGSPREINEEDIEGFAVIYSAWCRHPEDTTVVRVAGDSMRPILEPGSLVAVNHRVRNPKLLDGKIAAFRQGGGATVKICHFVSPGLVIAAPANPESRDFFIFKGEEADTCVIGKVEWWWGRQE